ncbi:DUF4291 domain-containing protein [Amycolatopsis sp. H20-H5]|uniref:DUF4291 domain-containing protein n=1 Tax=Amycolatopsis sp. H20-H5 TaxID=3046309 RepID=UPI002DBF63F5|nr:DUF4291 domain-containing protein [Amycolatopsis sp. H20-H5]MEC3977798.1 DUF4291 domain-containing protein [Amycolatopsis sp. H20-H5]
MNEKVPVPQRQIRAHHTETTIRVYQAYAPEIAGPALTAGTFVAPFKRERMTWIKPSFRWMAYRCGWAAKPGQERVLAIDITREGFEWALGNASLSHGDVDKSQPVRIQWDPERDLHHRPLGHRSIQIGLSRQACELYVDKWITNLTDITETMTTIGAYVRANRLPEAAALLPAESPYEVPAELAKAINLS